MSRAYCLWKLQAEFSFSFGLLLLLLLVPVTEDPGPSPSPDPPKVPLAGLREQCGIELDLGNLENGSTSTNIQSNSNAINGVNWSSSLSGKLRSNLKLCNNKNTKFPAQKSKA
ncbi:hypothetical protein GBA52_010678 [Prunus armeniaca]|nr:hypothetical protein GBA52_010678 [Prunus armeniaca]